MFVPLAEHSPIRPQRITRTRGTDRPPATTPRARPHGVLEKSRAREIVLETNRLLLRPWRVSEADVQREMWTSAILVFLRIVG
jgi:hypothetical protein